MHSEKLYLKILARLTILVFLFSNSIYAQSNRVHYTLDYSLSRSAEAETDYDSFEPSLGHSIFARAELGKKQHVKYTVGLGYLQSNIIFRDYSFMVNYKDEERHYFTNYFVIPAGIKFAFGSFYIHPEIGGSYNFSIHTKSYLTDPEMNRLDGIYSESHLPRSFKINFTSLLTLGYEFKIGSITMLSGINGYLALNPRFINTYGIGLLVGVKI